MSLRRSGWWRGVVLAAFSIVTAAAAAPPPAPPGFNVHLVREADGHRFWRGGAPRAATVKALADSAAKRGSTVTFVDLRHPANKDDRSGKKGRLSPQDEATQAERLRLGYISISALDKRLPDRLAEALRKGDVYMHCMYGVNRTGFATARYARAQGVPVPAEGLGKRDWRQGDAFQARLDPRIRP